jgi:glutathione S-transferase
MADFTVYSIPGSPYARAVLLTLIEKDIPYRFEPVWPQEFRREPHILRHRFGKVPVLQHDDFILYETQAILRYLDRAVPEPSLVPREIRKLARMDQLLNIHDCYLFRGVGDTLGFERTVKPRVMGLPPDETIIAAAMPHAQRVFDELARLLGDQPFLVGDQISLADLLIAPLMDFFVTSPEWTTLTAAHLNLCAWMQRMSERDSMRTTTWDLVEQLASRQEAAVR